MGFEETLADLIDKHLEREGFDGIISALELQLMATKEQEKEAMKALVD